MDKRSRLRKSPGRGWRGFTLLELVVIVMVVGFLAVMILPAVTFIEMGVLFMIAISVLVIAAVSVFGGSHGIYHSVPVSGH